MPGVDWKTPKWTPLGHALPFVLALTLLNLEHTFSFDTNVPLIEYCDTEEFKAECDEDDVILMTSAKYGRMHIGRCVEVDLGYLGCQGDVLSVVDRHCSGKSSCQVRIPDAEMERSHACFKELKNYLEAGYMCIPVTKVEDPYCEMHSEINLTAPHGYISSTSMKDTLSCGGASHPWVVLAQPGQKINFTLYDFSLEDHTPSYDTDLAGRDGGGADGGHGGGGGGGGEADLIQICHEYGIIEDSVQDKTSVMCGGGRRLSHLYLSEGHVVRVWITNPKDERLMKRFIVEYQVLGCPDISPPENAWFKRKSSGDATMGCSYTQITWSMRCEGHTWVGPRGNCSQPAVAEEHDELLAEEFPLSYGIAIAIIIGAAFGVALVIFIVGLVRYRRHCRQQSCSRETILLRQRPDQSGTPKPPPSHQTRLLEGESKSYPTELHFTPICRRQRHPVKVNGNQYEHIWEAPLPLPSGSATIDLHCTLQAQRHHPMAPLSCAYTTFKPENVNNAPALAAAAAAAGTGEPNRLPEPKAMYLTSGDIVNIEPARKNEIPYETTRYSSLDRRRFHEAEDI